MDDQRFGSAVRALRVRRGWRQEDLADRAGISPSVVSRLERGHLDTLTLRTIRRITTCLNMRVDFVTRWRGGDLDRMLAGRHAGLADAVVADLGRRGWSVRPEVTFSIFGERGSIDVLAYHPARRALLVVELKSDVVDAHALISQVDRYRRLAREVAGSCGWVPRVIGCWVVVGESRTNRRRVAAHRALLRAAFPSDGRAMTSWLRDPAVAISALSFRPVPSSPTGGRRRVRLARRRAPLAEPASAPSRPIAEQSVIFLPGDQ
ncbi:MAG: helix-turn-helix transcriptional regulator [Chloroflexi bacterium]|jgi:transcriptional regulator with XRE-family HTH domain|nr:helix-turn-helix transcriptional regulator [Chloroflexota bacterium]